MEVAPEVICKDVLSLVWRFKQEMMRMADEHQLTHVQLGALYMLHQHGELAMGKVAHALHCDPSNVTGIVDRLVGQKLVSREESAVDRRTKTIVLTPEGRAIIDEILTTLPQRMGCDRLSPAERQALHIGIQKIVG